MHLPCKGSETYIPHSCGNLGISRCDADFPLNLNLVLGGVNPIAGVSDTFSVLRGIFEILINDIIDALLIFYNPRIYQLFPSRDKVSGTPVNLHSCAVVFALKR